MELDRFNTRAAKGAENEQWPQELDMRYENLHTSCFVMREEVGFYSEER
jgi:hypothetical protein